MDHGWMNYSSPPDPILIKKERRRKRILGGGGGCPASAQRSVTCLAAGAGTWGSRHKQGMAAAGAGGAGDSSICNEGAGTGGREYGAGRGGRSGGARGGRHGNGTGYGAGQLDTATVITRTTARSSTVGASILRACHV